MQRVVLHAGAARVAKHPKESQEVDLSSCTSTRPIPAESCAQVKKKNASSVFRHRRGQSSRVSHGRKCACASLLAQVRLSKCARANLLEQYCRAALFAACTRSPARVLALRALHSRSSLLSGLSCIARVACVLDEHSRVSRSACPLVYLAARQGERSYPKNPSRSRINDLRVRSTSKLQTISAKLNGARVT